MVLVPNSTTEKGHQDHQVSQDQLVPSDPKEIKDHKELQDNRVYLVQQDDTVTVVPLEIQESMDLKVVVENLDYEVQLVNLVLLDQSVSPVFKDLSDLKEPVD